HRVLPFGCGAGVFYNYIDLRFYNPTDITFQIRLSLTAAHLKGAIFSSVETPHSYHVFEKNHRFVSQAGRNYRENEIWRELIDRRTGDRIAEEMIVKNHAEVKYELNFEPQACSL
ncbi:MAG: vancomycin resistance protein, partial [Acidobacteriota bacterium]